MATSTCVAGVACALAGGHPSRRAQERAPQDEVCGFWSAANCKRVECPMQRPMTLALWLGLFAVPAAALAQQPNNVVLHEGSTKQLTPHVWAIYGNPNIAIIVGSKATLVVDTGLGPRNGAFIAGEVSKLRKSAKLFLTTTHAHTEHSSGRAGFRPIPWSFAPRRSSRNWTR